MLPRAIVAIALSFILFGCATVGPFGLVYSSTNNPDLMSPGPSTNPGVTPVVGESCAFSVLNLIAVGDWSIAAALRAAGVEGRTLKNITVDHRTMSILIFYSYYCTRVTAFVAP